MSFCVYYANHKNVIETQSSHSEVVDDENDDSIDAFVSSMQVIEVELFKNHKFTTVAGLGSSVTLRGRWDIIGQDKDQIWLQVWRFGFGRSVSGS